MKIEQKEIDLIASALYLGDSKGVLKEVQNILRPYMLNKKSIKLNTIIKLEILLDAKLLSILTDKEALVSSRREKLKQLKIVTGELIPKVKCIKIDEFGTATLEDE